MSFHSTFLRQQLTVNERLATALGAFRSARILVTGASGIVGFAIALVLKELGVDLALHSRTPHARMAAELGSAPRWTHGALDAEIRKLGNFDLVFHCATYGQPQKFSADWRETIRLNSDVILWLLEMTGKLGFASTTEIYSGLTVPATETMVGTTTPQHPRSAYIDAKRLGEAICYHSNMAISNRIALASGPYPRLDDSRALYQIIRRARSAGRVQLMGGATNIRQYGYSVSCALRMIVTTALGRNPVYNNAGPYVVSMEDLGRMIAGRLGVEFVPAADVSDLAGAPSVVSIDSSLAAAEFAFLKDVDPSFETFVDAILESTRDA